jgi:hypothetical protein
MGEERVNEIGQIKMLLLGGERGKYDNFASSFSFVRRRPK